MTVTDALTAAVLKALAGLQRSLEARHSRQQAHCLPILWCVPCAGASQQQHRLHEPLKRA